MKFIQLLKILRAHLGLILFSVSGACLLATFVTATTSPKYLATSSVLINVADTPVNSTIPAPSQPHSSYLATQIDLITSQSVALKVVDRLHLVDDEQASRRFLGTESFFQEQPFQEQLERIKTGCRSLGARSGGRRRRHRRWLHRDRTRTQRESGACILRMAGFPGAAING
jgi:hypothetical protein